MYDVYQWTIDPQTKGNLWENSEQYIMDDGYFGFKNLAKIIWCGGFFFLVMVLTGFIEMVRTTEVIPFALLRVEILRSYPILASILILAFSVWFFLLPQFSLLRRDPITLEIKLLDKRGPGLEAVQRYHGHALERKTRKRRLHGNL